MLAEGRDALARVSALYLAGHESFHCFLLYCVELIKFHHQIIHDNLLLKQVSLQHAVLLQSSFSLLGRF